MKRPLAEVTKIAHHGPIGPVSGAAGAAEIFAILPGQVENGGRVVIARAYCWTPDGLSPDHRLARREGALANASLLAHWWNHGPKLLEALKQTNNHMNALRGTARRPARAVPPNNALTTEGL